MITLDQHLKSIDEDEAKEDAINLLAEQMLSASLVGINQATQASAYDFKYKDVMNATNGDEDFYNAFYEAAKKLIESI